MDDLTELYCLLDDFCKAFEPQLKARLLADGKQHRSRQGGLALAELMTLVVLFHQIRYWQVKWFYLHHACQHLRSEFPRLPTLSTLRRVDAALPACARCPVRSPGRQMLRDIDR